LRRRDAVSKTQRRRRRFAVAGLFAAALVAAFLIATALLFIWPSQGTPARANAIVVLDGPGNRLGTAFKLAREHRAPLLLISLGTPYSDPGNVCPPGTSGVRVVCFNPKPGTTRGEAEYVGRLARRYHWRSIVLVTMTPQITPGRVWLGRCAGPGTTVYAVAAPLAVSAWPAAVWHEWGAVINEELIQRSC
jgi:uncharacterized SAM-binding protein YcdF (DUF218 family)